MIIVPNIPVTSPMNPHILPVPKALEDSSLNDDCSCLTLWFSCHAIVFRRFPMVRTYSSHSSCRLSQVAYT